MTNMNVLVKKLKITYLLTLNSNNRTIDNGCPIIKNFFICFFEREDLRINIKYIDIIELKDINKNNKGET